MKRNFVIKTNTISFLSDHLKLLNERNEHVITKPLINNSNIIQTNTKKFNPRQVKILGGINGI